MKAMILAAGKGTRVRPLTNEMPKPMIPIIGKPVMEYLIEELARHGFDEIMVNVSHLPEKIENYFGLSRNNRYRNFNALNSVVSAIPDSSEHWKLIEGQTLEEYLAVDSNRVEPIEVENIFSHVEDHIGTYYLVKQAPVPWAWARNRDQINMPIQFVHVKIVRS